MDSRLLPAFAGMTGNAALRSRNDHCGETPAFPNTWIPACAGMTMVGKTPALPGGPACGAAHAPLV